MAFSVSLAMITSVLNMFTRDVKKIVNATIKLFIDNGIRDRCNGF